MPEKVSLKAAAGRIARAYEPEPVARIDQHQAVLVRYEGEYPAHSHDTDEFLLCLEGEITIDLPDGPVVLGPHEGLRIPKGTLHAPKASKAVGLLFESSSIATRLPGTTD